MAWILDGAAVLLIVLMIWLGYRRGFFKSMMRLISGILALLLAAWLATPVSEGIFSLFLENTITETIETEIVNVTDTSEETIEQTLDTFFAGLPVPLQTLLAGQGLTGEKIHEALSLSEGTSAGETARTLVQMVARPVVVAVLYMLCALVLFVIILLVLLLITRLLDGVLKLPLLKQVNKGLGTVLGLLEGLLLVCVCCSVLGWLTRVSDPETFFLTEGTLDQTYIVRHLDLSEGTLTPDFLE